MAVVPRGIGLEETIDSKNAHPVFDSELVQVDDSVDNQDGNDFENEFQIDLAANNPKLRL